jgi:hypothetical protein
MNLALEAISLVRSFHADVEALRVGTDGFQGTGSCEWGHEDIDVTLEWPNLAILSDKASGLLSQVDACDKTDVQGLTQAADKACKA